MTEHSKITRLHPSTNQIYLRVRSEVAVQTDASEDIVHEDVAHQNNALSEAKSLNYSTNSSKCPDCQRYMSDLCIETSINCDCCYEKLSSGRNVKSDFDEKQLAESRGDIDSDGYYCITVIVDGGWCVRNKVCLICHAIANGKERSPVLEKLERMINSNGK
ncbi:uncharacterized protein TNCV_3777591 [Trichonephila clavipes]|nr:uncharacterized protein TNCV_3777591 [Trichonephila clavipes]